MKNGNRNRGLTRTEVVVVGGCLVLLTLVILPALTSARDAGKRAVCLANLKTLGAAALLYARDYEDKIPCWGIEFDEVGPQGDPVANWLTKTTDSLTKAFEYGYIWEYVQNNAPYTCPSLTNKMNPKGRNISGTHSPYVWGWPDGQGTQNPPGPMWSYAVNGQAGWSMNDHSQWRANPELVLPSPTSVMMLFEQDYRDYTAFDNSVSLFASICNLSNNSDDSLGGYHMISEVIAFNSYYQTRKGSGNLVYFDGHVGLMGNDEFIIQRYDSQGTLELIGGYIDFTWPGF